MKTGMLLVVRAEPNWWKIFVRIFPPGSWFVQGGSVTTGSDGTATINFPVAFNYSPIPIAAAGDLTGTASNHVSVQTGSISKTSFHIRVSVGTVWATSSSHRWIAAGH